MKYILDTNFILRYLLADDQLMLEKSRKIFNKIKAGEIMATIEQAVFTEIIYVLSSFYKVPKDKISYTLSELIAYKGISCDKDVYLLALKYYGEKHLHIVDCLLLAISRTKDLALLSFDEKLLSCHKKN